MPVVRLPLLALIACLFVCLAPSVSLADTSVQDSLSKHIPGVEVARCMFPQGKLVLQKGEDLHVLRKGDAVPGQPGLRVLEITDRHAVLIQGPKGSVLKRSAAGYTGAADSGTTGSPPIPERLVKIEKAIDGEVTITVMSARMDRVEGPQLQGEDLIYSPWSEAGGQVEGSDASPKMAPLVQPRQVGDPALPSAGAAGSNDGEPQQ